MRKDHPHGRGEKPIKVNLRKRMLGSSPRAWGKDTAVLKDLLEERIIPTGVGKRKVQWSEPVL